MARLFVPPPRLERDQVVLEGPEHRYLARVLRLGAGDEVTCFDGQGAECVIALTSVGRHQTEARVLSRRRVTPGAGPEVTLIMALLKGERMDLVVQKATELGVARVETVVTTRSIPRLAGDRAAHRQRHWLAIGREAARQCGRATAPDIVGPRPLEEALSQAPAAALKLLFWEEAGGESLAEAVPPSVPSRVVVAVGPEGGFSRTEVDAAVASGFRVVSLGPRILRAETAALVALALVGYVTGDLGARSHGP